MRTGRRERGDRTPILGSQGSYGGIEGVCGGIERAWRGIGGFAKWPVYGVAMGSNGAGDFRIRFGGGARGCLAGSAGAIKGFERVIVPAVETVLVATHQVGVASVFGNRTDGVHGADWRRFGGKAVGLTTDLLGDRSGVDGPEPALTPLRDGHLFDEDPLGGGFVFGVERVEERGETLGGLAFDEDGVGEKTVTHVVAGRVALALRRDRASGFDRVRAIGG